MLKKELNQVKNVSLSEFYQDSFVGTPRTIIKIRRETMKKHPIALIMQDYFFDYFTTETGKRLGYKYFTMTSLSKILDVNRTTLYRSIQVTRENNILIFIDCEEGKICLNYTNANLEFEKKVLSGELIVKLKEQQIEILENNIVNFQKSEMNTSVQMNNNEPKKMNTNVHSVDTNVHLNNTSVAQMNASVAQMNTSKVSKTIVNSDIETLSKNPQESSLKNPYIKNPLLDLLGPSKEKTNLEKIEVEVKKEKGFFEKENEEEKSLELKPILKTQVEILEQKKEKIEFYFPTDDELEAKKKIENEIAKVRLDEMMAKIKAEKEIQKNNVPGPAPKPIEKSFVVETVSQNIDGDIVKEEKVINRLELNEEQRELREKIQEELNIININQFEDFFYKLDFDTYYETVSFVISEYKSGNVKSPSNYLKACLNKKVESQSIENLTTPFYWQQIFRYFNLFHFDKGSVVCTKSGVTLAHQMSANQDRVFLYLSTVFREVKKGNEEKQKELIEVFQAMGKFGLTVQEFKEIVSFNSATKENKEELIKIFREVI